MCHIKEKGYAKLGEGEEANYVKGVFERPSRNAIISSSPS